MLPRAREQRVDDSPEEPDSAAGSPAWRKWRARVVPLLRCHWLACLLLTAGLVLRVLALIAYQPALIYIDSSKYLYGAYPGSVPLGYHYLLKIILPVSNLAAVVAIQHLLGLAMGVALYVLLQRRGINRWLAALAMAPVLLDAYQVQMEQMIMPDAWFEALLVAGLVLLLWRPVITVPVTVAAGVLLGASATVWAGGETLIFPAVIFLLAAGGGWRKVVVRSTAMIAAFAVPILAYCSISYANTGHFWLARSQTTVGRTTAAADCATLKVPADVRQLCPSPSAQANGPDWLEHSGKSPLFATPIPAGTNRGALLAKLNSAIKRQQPLRVAAAIARDAARLFAPAREPARSVTPLSRWQFQTSYPTYPPWTQVRNGTIFIGLQKAFHPFHFVPLSPSYGGKAQVSKPVASFLRAYQLDGGYTPGPLYLLLALAGLAGSLLVLARRRLGAAGQQAGLACLLCTVSAAMVLLVPDVFEYSWRYELLAVIVLPAAGLLGLSAVLNWRRTAGSGTGGSDTGG